MVIFTHPDNAPEGHQWVTDQGKKREYIGPNSVGVLVFRSPATGIYSEYNGRGDHMGASHNLQDYIDKPEERE